MSITNNSTLPTYALSQQEFFDGVFSNIDGTGTYEDLMLTGNLDYTVSKGVVMYQNPDGNTDPWLSQKHSVPLITDTLTGEVSHLDLTVGRDTYTILQNHPLAHAAAEVGQAGLGLVNWQGVVTSHGRGRVALWGTVGEQFTIADDPHQAIAVMRWSHDGSWAAGFKSFVGRLWCQNIIPSLILGVGRTGMQKQSSVTIKHTKSGEVKVQTMTDAIAAATVDPSQVERTFMSLYDTKVEPTDLEEYLRKVVPFSEALLAAPEHLLSTGEKRSRTIAMNKRAAIRDVFMHSDTQENLRWTAAGLFHAAVEAMDHRSSGDRGMRIVDGADEKAKVEAFRLALAI